jgi:hypothetical protein
MSKLSIANLALLVEFSDRLSYAALGFINMPKFQNSQVEAYLDPYWGHYINGMWGRVIGEIKARVPADEREAEIRAKVLRKHFADWQTAIVTKLEGLKLEQCINSGTYGIDRLECLIVCPLLGIVGRLRQKLSLPEDRGCCRTRVPAQSRSISPSAPMRQSSFATSLRWLLAQLRLAMTTEIPLPMTGNKIFGLCAG